MDKFNKKIIEIIKKNNLETMFKMGNFGLEKENVRVNKKGLLAMTSHPKKFGDKWRNPYIKTDFSESQIEMVTPPCNSIEEVYEFMGALNDIVSLDLDEELLWPQSNPPILPSEKLIPIANFNGNTLEKYREYLATKYSRKRQLISGVHFNFSFKDEFINIIYNQLNTKNSINEFKNKFYLNIARNFIKYQWLLKHLTAASPVFHESYIKKCVDLGKKVSKGSFKFNDINSIRTSSCGYRNKENFFVSHNSLEEYISDLKLLISKGVLYSEKEYYSNIRLKSLVGDRDLDSLSKNGIDYLEFRFLDLNPLTEFGISIKTLKLLHGFIMYMALKVDEGFEEDEFNKFIEKTNQMEKIEISNENEKNSEFKNKAILELNNIEKFLDSIGLLGNDYEEAFKEAKEIILDPKKSIANIIKEKIKKEDFIDFHLEVAKKAIELAKERPFSVRGFEDLELSTQILIRDGIKKGISFELLDREENFIELSLNDHKEYVKQATKTSKDSYITALVMENKEVTKKILKRNKIKVPKGRYYIKKDEAINDYEFFKGNPIVIKPKTTNFGIGISIFKEKYSREEFLKAIDIAFNEDTSILIEEFIKGKEYRFLVIDYEVVGILHRVPANVIGDGRSNIKKLVEVKNKNPLRGKGYKKPLEKIKLGEAEKFFLKNQGKDFDYIPKLGEIIYLRENSNISTGGDSLDFTDEMDKSYKDIAINSAKALNANITGIDIMIQDINTPANEENYSIIELNFNPAIHIHCYPYKGKNRKAGEKVLDLLFNKEE